MPMPPVAEATHPLGRPGNDMPYSGCHLLLAARTPKGLRRAGAGDALDEPLAVAVQLTTFHPAQGP